MVFVQIIGYTAFWSGLKCLILLKVGLLITGIRKNKSAKNTIFGPFLGRNCRNTPNIQYSKL